MQAAEPTLLGLEQVACLKGCHDHKSQVHHVCMYTAEGSAHP